jgi:hypothetical protein
LQIFRDGLELFLQILKDNGRFHILTLTGQ